MTEFVAPLRSMRFVLHEVFEANRHWSAMPALKERVDTETANAILEEGAQLVTREMAPLNLSGDRQGALFQDGQVTTPSGFKEAFATLAQGGWIGLGGNPDLGGVGMPKMLCILFEEMMYSANNAFALYPGLTSGACLAIDTHASAELKRTYLPNMYAGHWSGSMCLTESHCGTDLGLIRTRAQDRLDGTWTVTGNKIFITAGEHDLAGNIVHLVLAKTAGAPEGVRGLSLFLVPKFWVNQDGSLGDANGVSCASIEDKMGIKASATCTMNFDGARGYLIGQLHQGLAAMFTMMNYERLSIGLQGVGSSQRSYQNAVAYARSRLQGRAADSTGTKDAAPIIVHPDVRRMLMNIKATTEAGRAFSTYVALQLDQARYAEDAAVRQRASGLATLLTPVAKAFCTDLGLENCIQGQQVLGGHGYIRESGQEQLVRDVRIAQIYEGTNGIQALDLMGRKIVANGGALFELFAEEVEAFANDHDNGSKGPFGERLADVLTQLRELTLWVIKQSAADPRETGAASCDYLNAFGYVAYAYMWARMAKTASAALARDESDHLFYKEKVSTAQYYFKRVLPRFEYHVQATRAGAAPLFELDAEQF